MIRHMLHSSPPRLMAPQPTGGPDRRESPHGSFSRRLYESRDYVGPPPLVWLSRSLRGSCRKENAPAEQVEAGATVHLTLDQLEPGDLPLRVAAAPAQPQRSQERGSPTFGRRLAKCPTPRAPPYTKSR